MATVACAPDKPEASLAKAQAALERNERNEAVVLLKDLLQRHPDQVEARLLLGDTLLKTGDAVGALAQFDKAIEQGAKADALTLSRARAQLEQGKFKLAEDLLDAYSPEGKELEAERLYLLARAQLGLTRNKAAEEGLKSALTLHPTHVEAQLLLARLALLQGRTEDSLKLLKDLSPSKEHEAERRTLSAHAQVIAGAKPPEVRKAYEAVLEIAPNDADALAGLAGLHLREGDYGPAKSRIADLKRKQPKDLRGVLLQATLDALEGRTDAAREGAINVLKLFPDNLGALSLAGQVALKERDWTMAETHFAKALSLSPDANDLRAMLARVYLDQGNSEKALATVMPRLSGGTVSPGLLSVAGMALLERGQVAQANTLFSKALANQNSEEERVKIALLQSQLGIGDQGMSVLSALRREDPQGATALLAMVSSHLRRGQLDEALVTVSKLEEVQPDRALPRHLHGQILLNKGETASARQQLEAALKKQPDFLPSLHMLAALDLAQGAGLPAALARYDGVLSVKPRHVEARLAQADLCLKAGDEAQALKRLKTLADDVPTDLQVRKALIAHQVGHGRLAEAEKEAKAGLQKLPDQVELLDLLGRAQFSAGNTEAALQTFRKLGTIQPKSPLAMMRQSDALAAKGALGEAAQLLADAAKLAPRDVEVSRAQVMLAIRARNFEAASTQARALQANSSLRLAGLILEGDVELARQRWREAALVYKRALELAPGLAEAAIKAHQALLQSSPPEAESFAQGWARKNPGALAFHIHLGDVYGAAGEFAKAEQAYVRALTAQPDSTVLTNNLAWTQMKQGRTDGLVPLQSVVARDPLNAEARDTLSAVLELSGKREQALQTQLEALRLAPANPAIRLRAVALLQSSGKSSEASRELQLVQAGQLPPALRADFDRLSASLKR